VGVIFRSSELLAAGDRQELSRRRIGLLPSNACGSCAGAVSPERTRAAPIGSFSSTRRSRTGQRLRIASQGGLAQCETNPEQRVPWSLEEPATQFVAVRTTGDPVLLAADLRAIVKGASPMAVIEDVMTMEAQLMRSLARPRLYAVLLGGFATFALLIAIIGLSGGLSYGVTQRTREIGVEPLDPRTFAVVGVTLLVVAMTACAIPARRAARIDAISALRG
jgi:hypothetical protein